MEIEYLLKGDSVSDCFRTIHSGHLQYLETMHKTS